jgi:hypothetical protein
MDTRERPTIHYSELAPAPPGSALGAEWETYRREVGRLIVQGARGQVGADQGPPHSPGEPEHSIPLPGR